MAPENKNPSSDSYERSFLDDPTAVLPPARPATEWLTAEAGSDTELEELLVLKEAALNALAGIRGAEAGMDDVPTKFDKDLNNFRKMDRAETARNYNDRIYNHNKENREEP
jgi:hypothetical protein